MSRLIVTDIKIQNMLRDKAGAFISVINHLQCHIVEPLLAMAVASAERQEPARAPDSACGARIDAHLDAAQRCGPWQRTYMFAPMYYVASLN